VLIAGALSSERSDDVKAVLHGPSYAKKQSGGPTVNVMSRDTIDAIPSLKQNLEGLIPSSPNYPSWSSKMKVLTALMQPSENGLTRIRVTSLT
jgi:hypothetical protein